MSALRVRYWFTQVPVSVFVVADHQGLACRVASQVTVPRVEMVAVMVPLAFVHQIDAPLPLRRAIAAGVGWWKPLGPVERTAQRGWVAASSVALEPCADPWWVARKMVARPSFSSVHRAATVSATV